MPYTIENTDDITQVTWNPITGANAGGAYALKHTGRTSMSVQVIGGTAGSVSLQTSNDGVNWAPLRDRHNAVIAMTSLALVFETSTSAKFIRPLGNASSSNAVVRLVIRSW
jgi:hypothetical protein